MELPAALTAGHAKSWSRSTAPGRPGPVIFPNCRRPFLASLSLGLTSTLTRLRSCTVPLSNHPTERVFTADINAFTGLSPAFPFPWCAFSFLRGELSRPSSMATAQSRRVAIVPCLPSRGPDTAKIGGQDASHRIIIHLEQSLSQTAKTSTSLRAQWVPEWSSRSKRHS
ncbi:hypothetical protein VTI74DRAFT_2461 [Chaetomium olivicolor]